MKDIYVKRPMHGFLTGFVCEERSPSDWNGGCSGHGESGARFYPQGTFQYKVVRRLLMDGRKEDAATGFDITAGPVYGLDANGEADLQYTGYFSNPNHVENPSHE